MTLSTTSTPPTLPVALTIAGSDSGGGAGIQADLKTFHRFDVFGTSVVTAITAQNTTGVQAIHPIPLADVRAQIDSVASDLKPAGVKTGMLATAELVGEVARALEAHALSRYVLDPVMVATSGDRLLERDAERALAEELLPLASVVTPNLEEAAILVGQEVTSVEGMKAAAHRLVEMGASAALVKGGHLEDAAAGAEVVDVLWDGSDEHLFRHPRVETIHTHGTGCTLSAAIAAGLARGDDLLPAVERALRYVARAIATAPGLGAGRGPVNHFASPD
ncbi:MAG: bifunctional hydroxymethylpyrimidine kinase/phosphomethylpyrimidine kinase [Longimicrobiales bacterium]|nr:bifunctional hydroxymethylpyrimidine kinase/phosphomethylpyrimidine kinase [Longimicrobiales bacterium]